MYEKLTDLKILSVAIKSLICLIKFFTKIINYDKNLCRFVFYSSLLPVFVIYNSGCGIVCEFFLTLHFQNTFFMEEYMLPCMNKTLFGIDCMGCGIQRAVVLLLQGKFVDAFYMYPAIYPLILFFIFIGLNFLHKAYSYHKHILTTGIITAVVMVVSYFYKVIFY